MTLFRRYHLSILAACLLFLAPAGAGWAQDQPLVTQIDVVGAHKVEEATVRFKLKTRVGDPYSPELIREDIKSLYSLGYFEDIIVRAAIFEGGLKLIFELHEKPSIQVIYIVGNKKISTEKIKAKIDLVEGAIVPPGALAKNAEKIRLYYEDEGYYQARVEGEEERVSPEEVSVTFKVLEGAKFDVGEIVIEGNKHLKSKDIKSHMETSAVYLFFFGGTLKREELRRDLDRIRAYYLDNGYLDIVVDDPKILVDSKRKKLKIVIRLQEGPQYRIGSLSIKGNSLFTEADIRKLLKSKSGGIFSRETLQTDVVAVTDKYSERGYLFADVAPMTDIQTATTTVNISLEVTEGQQAFIHRILINGNVRTREKVIRRELFLVEGDVFNSALLNASKRNLMSMGYFEDVKMDTKRTEAADLVDVTVDLKEKPTGAFTIGAGFSSVDGVLGMATISQKNLFGMGKSASVGAQIGQYANRLNFVYSDPHFWDTNFLVEPQAWATDTNYQVYQDFNQSNQGGSLLVGHHLFERVGGSLTYALERIRIKDVTSDAPYIIQEQAAVNNGVSYTSAITGKLVRDTRDSATDPTSGLYILGGASYAGGILGADNNFTKYTLDISYYRPVWWKLVWHTHFSLGYGKPFGSTSVLPVQERFWLGGMDSIRGFRNFTVSPEDVNGNPMGGDKAGFVQNEIQFPINEKLRLKGLVFLNVGNVYGEQDTFDAFYKRRIKRSAGVGFLFNSPMGPIRVDWGFNLAPLPGERSNVVDFNIGTSF